MENNKARSLEFTLAIGCPLQCKYCPQDKLLGKYKEHSCKRMSFETFMRVLSQIMPGGGVIISGMVEPFSNPECSRMIKYAYDKGYKVRLFSSLQGMVEDDLQILHDVKFDEITIHIPDKELNSKFKITGQYLKVFKKFHELFETQISAYSVHGTIHQTVEKYIFKNKPITSSLFDRAGNLAYTELSHREPKGRIRCMLGSKTNIGVWTPEVLPDGTVTLCCMDYSMKHILGNIVEQDWPEIVAGEEYQRILNGFEDDSIDILCRKCTGGIEAGKLPSYKFLELCMDYQRGNVNDANVEHICKMIVRAKKIAIFGLGRMFQDQYFYGLWNEILQADIFSDNNEEMWGKVIENKICVTEPDKLKNILELLVIIWVKEDKGIKVQLKNMGIEHVIGINDIYDVL